MATTNRPAQVTSKGRTRPAAYAGSWYPNGAEALRSTIDKALAKAPSPPADASPPIALIGPHAGLTYSGEVAAAGYGQLREADVKRVFLIGPSHRARFEGIALPEPDVMTWDTPLGPLSLDQRAMEELRTAPGFDGPGRVHAQEHSLELHAVFLAAVVPKAKLIPLVVGHHQGKGWTERFANKLRQMLEPGDVVVASSDFTHYGMRFGYVPFTENVPEKLEGLLDDALAGLAPPSAERFAEHLDETADTICGREPIRLLLALLPQESQAQVVARDLSGHMTGQWDASVSYASLVYRHPRGWPRSQDPVRQDRRETAVIPEADKSFALKLARRTLEGFLRENRVLTPEELGVPTSPPWHQHYATFVTLERHGQLRGCIGHIEAVQSLWQDIRDNAIAAAVRDPRFPPVSAAELTELELEISVLTPLRPIEGPEQFEVGKQGIVFELFGRRAVFLPQVAPEHGWDRETTLSHLASKAGLQPDAWRETGARFEVFTAQVLSESDASPE